MYGRLKLSHHQHSGRLRPHEHTSYVPLAILALIVGFALAAFTVTTTAQSPGPQSGSVGLTGTMPAPPPKTAATINAPSSQQRFSTSPIKVSGSCPTGTLVEIFKNNIFAGSAPCEGNGSYSLEIDLLFGQNILKAIVYDALNQAGPESNSVTVFYDALLPQPAPSSFFDFSGAQLILNTDAAFRGAFPNQKLNVPISVIGGTPPFAVNIQWGDSTNEVLSRSDNSTFNRSHAYKKPGTYKITLQGRDNKNLAAFLTVAAIVNGQPELFASSTPSKPSANKLLVLWPAYAIATTFIISFWLGERREKKILGKSTKDQAPPFGVMPQSS